MQSGPIKFNCIYSVNAHFVTSDGVCVAYFIAPATAGTIPSYMNELDSQLRGLEARRGGYFKAAEYDEHRRGKFKFRTFGISYGGGQKVVFAQSSL